MFEILESLADCQAILRRHPYTKAVQTFVIYDIPPNILAQDCLNILMREAGNLGVLEGLDMVLTIPPIHKTSPQLPWRLYRIGGRLNYSHHLLNVDALNVHIQEIAPGAKEVTRYTKELAGYELSLKLHAMYEEHFYKQDQWDLHDYNEGPSTSAPEPIASTFNPPHRPNRPGLPASYDPSHRTPP